MLPGQMLTQQQWADEILKNKDLPVYFGFTYGNEGEYPKAVARLGTRQDKHDNKFTEGEIEKIENYAVKYYWRYLPYLRTVYYWTEDQQVPENVRETTSHYIRAKLGGQLFHTRFLSWDALTTGKPEDKALALLNMFVTHRDPDTAKSAGYNKALPTFKQWYELERKKRLSGD